MDLKITINGYNTITIDDQFFFSEIEFLELSDGTTINLYNHVITTWGTSGDDTLSQPYRNGTEDDVFYGLDGNDVINASDGNDILYGGVGNDSLRGNYGDDVLNMGAGNDSAYGHQGNDTFIYTSGLDLIKDTSGVSDVLHISNGFTMQDIASFATGSYDLTIVLEAGVNEIVLDYHDYPHNTTNQIETLVFDDGYSTDLTNYDNWVLGTNNSDNALNGTTADNILVGKDGDDILNGLTGNDELLGGEGNDTLSGAEGDDILYGDAGNDTFVYYEGLDVVYDTQGSDTLLITGPYTIDDLTIEVVGNDVKFIFDSGINEVLLKGQAGINADAFIETLEFFGGESYAMSDVLHQEITGTVLNDTLMGSALDNVIDGYQGNDVINGNGGEDILAGGDGADTFVYETATALDGVDTITDFDIAGNDKLDISNLLIDYSGNITDYLEITDNGADSIVKVDLDGLGTAYSMTQIATLSNATGLTDEAALVSSGNIIAPVSLNNAPVAQDDYFDGLENTVNAGNLLIDNGNGPDTDYDNDTLTVQAGTFATLNGGSVVIETDGDFTYTPVTGYDGVDSFTYTLSDGQGGSDTATAEINVYNLVTPTSNTWAGTAGNDWIDNNGGSDNLYGYDGDDVYIWNVGYGNDIIKNDTGGYDKIILGNSIGASDVRLSNSGGFKIYIGSETISLVSQFYNSDTNIEELVFNDGTVTSLTHDITLEGTSAGEVVSGVRDSNDVLFGYGGNDTLYGSSGDDTYVWNVGDGNDVISDWDGNDKILFGENIDQSNVRVEHLGGEDLFIHINIEKITIRDHMNGTNEEIETLEFADGSTINIANNITFTGTSADETVRGVDDNNVLYGLDGNDTLWGYDGDDTLYGGHGADALYGGEGADTYVFEADTAFSGIDEISGFNQADGDALDVSDMLSGYDPLTDALADFVEVTDSGSHSAVSVDMDGTGSLHTMTNCQY